MKAAFSGKVDKTTTKLPNQNYQKQMNGLRMYFIGRFFEYSIKFDFKVDGAQKRTHFVYKDAHFHGTT